ncbi:uncharacterized protein PV06_02470 [Exophiala oligosperma]|uniref:Glutamine amidotransferase type-2 domain-containing protein n=1 Tax=Exophiala oligosperma TaxID=215243 RepID=A0A0D2DUM5_9EURO|nr:uncharacterized protein PV06_02470 [Exophiala oligosperma]KIW46838.1 hypothetical protein PV06_02470 [Exophiala oligosperma]
MCGIFFSVAKNRHILPDQEAVDALHARGPDSYKVLKSTYHGDSDEKLHLTFISSVLALRGANIQQQPLHDPLSRSVFCWNGEAWKSDGVAIEGNDSAYIWHLLQISLPHSPERQHRITQVLSQIAGPFAFVFYDAPTATVYYGRDRLGRRSLLINQGDNGSLTLASTSTSTLGKSAAPSEISTETIHFLQFSGGGMIRGKLPWASAPYPINKSLPDTQIATLPSQQSVDDLLTHLRRSLILRSVDIRDHSHPQMTGDSAKVAILFSGGLDCTLLARIIHEILPPDEVVDLLNVAFENPRSLAAKGSVQGTAYELCPDRVTGRSSFAEICEVCPQRKWRFVAINVPYTESIAHKPMIMRLMYPHNTEMDLSIAMALYFAARGQGELLKVHSNVCSEPIPFLSTARVLISGLGADELYAGYSRHAAAFSREGFRGLADELEMDFNRIGSRNLGRDDRVMSCWGKEIRYPYLDEDFFRFSLDLPVWEKAGFRPGKPVPKHHEATGVARNPEDLEPAKMLLRLAAWHLGLKRTATERKRAIQFGARTAKMEAGKGRTKGTDILTAAA